MIMIMISGFTRGLCPMIMIMSRKMSMSAGFARGLCPMTISMSMSMILTMIMLMIRIDLTGFARDLPSIYDSSANQRTRFAEVNKTWRAHIVSFLNVNVNDIDNDNVNDKDRLNRLRPRPSVDLRQLS